MMEAKFDIEQFVVENSLSYRPLAIIGAEVIGDDEIGPRKYSKTIPRHL